MSKRRGKSKSQRKKQRAGWIESGPAVSVMPDRRVMEGVMRNHFRGLTGFAGDTPLDRAQDLMYEAFEAGSQDEQVSMAQKALEISPDCVDAYVMLAENARTVRQALELYEQGVAAGERALGKEAFTEHVGRFWGVMETRPYMRAREGLAECLWSVGRRAEAIGHFEELLRLNPNDNQGVRDILQAWYILEDRDEDLARLLEKYSESAMATHAYAKALLVFRQEGDSSKARSLLKQAHKVNRHVPSLLAEIEPLPLQTPDSYSLGSREEAILYSQQSIGCWKQTPGAQDWITATLIIPEMDGPSKPAVGPLPIITKRLLRLPQKQDVWQADYRSLPVTVADEGRPVQPWAILVASRSDNLIVGQNVLPEAPTADEFWDTLANAMQDPVMAEPHRPTEVQLRRGEINERQIAPHLKALGIRFSLHDSLDQLDPVFDGLEKVMGGDPVPGLLESPGVTPELAGRFYEAAAEFFEKAPWKQAPTRVAVRVECDRFSGGPWFALVMGQTGLATGLVLYEDLEGLARMWRGELTPEEHFEEALALSMTFDAEADVPTADLDAIRQHGWKVAGPTAYPQVFRKKRGREILPPLPWELQLMTAALGAIPTFVARRPAGEGGSEKLRVASGQETIELMMTWVEE